MRINKETKSIDIETRDMNYILPQYVRNYMFYTNNEDPVEIVFPMFSSVPHPLKAGVRVPIRWVPEISEIAIEIKEDGKDIPEATEEQIASVDTKDEEIKKLKAELQMLQVNAKAIGTTKTSSDSIQISLFDRTPRQPEHLASGQLDSMHSRDRTDLAKTKADLADQPDIDDSKEKPLSDEEVKKLKG